MKVPAVIALVAMTVASASEAQVIQPAYREIRISGSGGVVFPSGTAAKYMKSGRTVGGEVGIALSRRITAGIRLDIGSLPSKIDATPPTGILGIPTGDNNWTWYAGALFGEYAVVESRLSPIVGGRVGIGGIHISYAQETNGSTGRGNYGVGYGMFVGVRYRASQRIGGVLDFGAERCPRTSTGLYYPMRMGLAVFL